MIQYIKFGQNPSFGSRDRVQTSFSGQNFTFKVLAWPSKWGQGHQNLINSLNCLNDTIHKVWPESIFWFKRSIWCRQAFFGQNFTFKELVWPWKWVQGHQNLIISYRYLSGVSVQVWSKSTNCFKRQSADKAQFYSLFIVWWPWKSGQGHENLINSFNYTNDTIHKVWPESTIWFKR